MRGVKESDEVLLLLLLGRREGEEKGGDGRLEIGGGRGRGR